MRLKDKIAIVTGGGSGFGEGIVRKFIAEGARVVVADRDQAAAERWPRARRQSYRSSCGYLQRIRFLGRRAESPSGIRRTRYPRQQCWCRTHAATARNGDRRDVRQNRQRQHEVHLLWREGHRATFQAAKYGVVLNVASTGGVSPRPNLTWYNASKGWVITATRAMAVELAPFGIRVNAINPCRPRNAAPEDLHGAGHARDPRKIPVDDFNRPLLHARRHGQRRCLPVLRRGKHDHGRRHGSRGGRCI